MPDSTSLRADLMTKWLVALVFVISLTINASTFAAGSYQTPAMDSIWYVDAADEWFLSSDVGQPNNQLAYMPGLATGHVYTEYRISDFGNFSLIDTIDLKFSVAENPDFGSGNGINYYIQPYYYTSGSSPDITLTDRLGDPGNTNTLLGGPINLTDPGYVTFSIKSMIQDVIDSTGTHIGFAFYTDAPGVVNDLTAPPPGTEPSGYPASPPVNSSAGPIVAWTLLAASNNPPYAKLVLSTGSFDSSNFGGTPVNLNAGIPGDTNASNDPDLDGQPGGYIQKYTYTITNDQNNLIPQTVVTKDRLLDPTNYWYFNPSLEQSTLRSTTDTATAVLSLVDDGDPPLANNPLADAPDNSYQITYVNNANTTAVATLVGNQSFSASVNSLTASAALGDPDMAVNALGGDYAAFEQLSYTWQVGASTVGTGNYIGGSDPTQAIAFSDWLTAAGPNPTTQSTALLTLTARDRWEVRSAGSGGLDDSTLSIAYENAATTGGDLTRTDDVNGKTYTATFTDQDLTVNSQSSAFEQVTWELVLTDGLGNETLVDQGVEVGTSATFSHSFFLSDSQIEAYMSAGFTTLQFTFSDLAGTGDTLSIFLAEVPEPTTILLWSMLGTVGLAFWKFRRRKAA